MSAVLTKVGDSLELDLSPLRGSDFQDALAKVKNVPGRKFDGDRKLWILPAEPDVAERVVYSLQPDASPDLLEWVRRSRIQQAKELATPLPKDADLRMDAEKLYPFQRAAVDKMADERRIILADDMGLGKTLQALASVEEWRIRNNLPKGHKLIVCPNSVKGVWAREIHKWIGDDEPYTIINGTTPQARHNQLVSALEKDHGWIIVNWEQVRVVKEKVKNKYGGTKIVERIKEPLFEHTQWQAVIADEAHRAKNRKAAQSRGLWRCHGDLQLALTGTPILNSPDEVWSILHWLFPKEYTSYWRFYEQYVDYYEGYFGKVITGVRNPDALRFELKDRLIRRTKDEVLDLPAKTRITVPVELTKYQRKMYKDAEKNLWLEIARDAEEGDDSAKEFIRRADAGANIYEIPNGAARTVRLRQVASTPALLEGKDDSAKLDTAAEIIADAQKQMVVFSEFVQTCNILVARLRKRGINAEVYTGDTDANYRTVLEDKFQRGEIDVLVGTIPAMREGITLHAADTVMFLERHWTPGWNEQAEDRVHRNGQKENVTVLILEAQDTVDQSKIRPTNKLKEAIIKSVLPKDEINEQK